MDVLLGDDETRAGARLALICHDCRLVNGQAPPGVKRLEDLGKWRCGGCGAMNGEETEAKKIVASIREQATQRPEHNGKRKGTERGFKDGNGGDDDDDASASAKDGHGSDITQYSTEDSDGDEERQEIAGAGKNSSKSVAEPEVPRRRSTRPTKGKTT